MLVDAGDYQAAATELELAVKYGPDDAAAHLNLGNAYRGQKAFERAEAAYQRALALDPGMVDVYFNLGVLYLDGEKPGLATRARLEKALDSFDRFSAGGGRDPNFARYRRDAATLLEKERRRLAREEREQLRREAGAVRKDGGADGKAAVATPKPKPKPKRKPAPTQGGATP
jgi:tetratricopeptide (TPR) repeat protein